MKYVITHFAFKQINIRVPLGLFIYIGALSVLKFVARIKMTLITFKSMEESLTMVKQRFKMSFPSDSVGSVGRCLFSE